MPAQTAVQRFCENNQSAQFRLLNTKDAGFYTPINEFLQRQADFTRSQVLLANLAYQPLEPEMTRKSNPIAQQIRPT